MREDDRRPERELHFARGPEEHAANSEYDDPAAEQQPAEVLGEVDEALTNLLFRQSSEYLQAVEAVR
jgi:hypothetical protein